MLDKLFFSEYNSNKEVVDLTQKELSNIINAKVSEICLSRCDSFIEKLKSSENIADSMALLFKENVEVNADILEKVLMEVMDIKD